MKAAVKWEAANRYRAALALLLQKSKGLNVNQVTFYAAALRFNSQHGLDIDANEVELGVYRFRAIVSQLGNMKTKGRKVPRQWLKEFGMIMDMVAKDEADNVGDKEKALAENVRNEEKALATIDSDDDVVFMGAPAPKLTPLVDLDGDDGIDTDSLRFSANPELQQILHKAFEDEAADTVVRGKRLTTKSRDPSFSTAVGGMALDDIKELVALPAKSVGPASFATLNRDLKKKKNYKGQGNKVRTLTNKLRKLTTK